MNLVDTIAKQAALLPREIQLEVLDFVEYLVAKHTPKSLSEDEAWEEVSQHQMQSSFNAK